MRFPAYATVRSARIWFVALLAGAGIFAVAVPAAQASFGVEGFFAGNCTVSTCGELGKSVKESEYFTQAAGHPNFGISDFTLKTKVVVPEAVFEPEGVAEELRVDVPPGLSTNPEAVPKCPLEDFTSKPVAPGIFEESKCEASTILGTNEVTVLAQIPSGPFAGKFIKKHLEGNVYNLVQPEGLPSDFGVAINLAPLGIPYFAHVLIEGGVAWNSDYHEYFTIKNLSKELPLVQSRLIYKGNNDPLGAGAFLTNPSACNGPQTTTLLIKSYEGESVPSHFTTPVGASGCELVPFEPEVALKLATTKSDQPDGATVELKVPQKSGAGELNSSDLDVAHVTLPEGMTLNPSAAHGLEACTEEQAGLKALHSGERTTGAVTCPEGSKIGTVAIEVPTLPAKSLEGNVYLGSPNGGPITGPPYTIYFNAESKRFGVAVRQKGSVVPNEATGRLTATFAENPQAPFSSLSMNFKGGPLAPIANPLACGTATTETSLVPYIGSFATKTPSFAFTVDSNGSGGPCPSPLPFAPTQSTSNQPATGGSPTNFTFNVTRPQGQQYLSQIRTVLPAGLVGQIPTVALCTEAQVSEAAAGTGGCPASSRIGSVTVLAGAGSAPYQFNGSAYLTGPYNGAPYGLAIVVPANAGPFNLGNVVVHETVSVEPYTARVVVAGSIPTIYKGIPLRMQSLNVEVNRQGFMLNPTSCTSLLTESTLTGITLLGSSTTTTANVASPFTTEECSKLAFKPSLTGIAGGKPTRANGANLEVNISQPAGQANLKQVTTMLPKQLPVRQSTLTKACPQATFEAGAAPGGCKIESKVGTATATTPTLPGKLTGSAYLVSHGNEAFPNLDLIMQGDGVTVIMVGHTKVTNSIITTSFESLPDVPVTSFSLYLPSASNSLLAANGNLCTSNLVMPTTIIAQNGAKITQNTKISTRNCPVHIVKHKTSGTTATMTVQVPAAGSISAGGTDLKFNKRNIGKAERTTIKTSLTRVGKEVLRKFRTLRIKVRVGFVPKKKGATSTAYATVTFRA